MKLKSLIPTLAMLLFAAAANAQSDGSVGGSFGTSFNHRATSGGALSGTTRIGERTSVALPQQSLNTTSRTHTQRSFWDRLTGRNRNTSDMGSSHTQRSHGWFGHSHATTHQNLRSNAHLQSHSRQSQTGMNTSTTTHRSGWHMPFFGRK